MSLKPMRQVRNNDQQLMVLQANTVVAVSELQAQGVAESRLLTVTLPTSGQSQDINLPHNFGRPANGYWIASVPLATQQALAQTPAVGALANGFAAGALSVSGSAAAGTFSFLTAAAGQASISANTLICTITLPPAYAKLIGFSAFVSWASIGTGSTAFYCVPLGAAGGGFAVLCTAAFTPSASTYYAFQWLTSLGPPLQLVASPTANSQPNVFTIVRANAQSPAGTSLTFGVLVF